MQDIKLIILLKTLSKEEFRRLGKFLKSPFFNYSKPVLSLYEILKNYFPTFESPKLTQENISRKVYPNTTFNPNKFWQLTSKLTRIIEKFIVIIELEVTPSKEEKLLIQSLANRNKNTSTVRMSV